MLDRAALDYCLADAFHPSCEITWPMRHATMYSAPFRVRHAKAGERSRTYGDVLTPRAALAADGPLHAQRAGGLTRWLGLPWQTDTASCRSQAEYDPTYDPYVPAFWPARVPNQVLEERDYRTVLDTTKSRVDRVAAFKTRTEWIPLTVDDDDYIDQITEMIDRWSAVGLIEARSGVHGDADIAPVIYVSDAKPPAPQAQAPSAGSTERAGAAPPPVRSDHFRDRRGNFPFARPRQ
jgi:hypothetical protein